MLNSFPQGGSDPDLTMQTYRAALRDIPAQAVIEAAERFVKGRVAGQSKKFAPSIAEFLQEAERIAELMPYRDRLALDPPKQAHHQPLSRNEQARMRLKMPLLREAMSRGQVDKLATLIKQQKADDMEELIALAREWEIRIPDELQAA